MNLKFIIDKDYDKRFAKDEGMVKYIDAQYDVTLKYLEITKDLYQKSWDEIDEDFSDYVEKITGYKWFYDTYECVVSVIHSGKSNWGTAPKIIRTWKENPYSMRRITAHELILSHYFEIHRRHYKDSGLTDRQIWALSEIASFAITSLDPKVKEFWPWHTDYYTNHNYPNLVELQNDLKEVFISMKNFDDYIQKGIELVKKYPIEHFDAK